MLPCNYSLMVYADFVGLQTFHDVLLSLVLPLPAWTNLTSL